MVTVTFQDELRALVAREHERLDLEAAASPLLPGISVLPAEPKL